MNRRRYDHGPPGIVETLVGWVFSLFASALALGVVIDVLVPLLPWIVGLVVLAGGARWWYRNAYW